MGNRFSAHEIVEIGVHIEKNGYDFYAEILKKCENARAKEIFSLLRDEEEKHIGKFSEILKSVHKYEPEGAYPEEYFMYMNSLASDHIFTKEHKGKEIGSRVSSDMEAVDLGIRFEKDSIVFYEGLREIARGEDKNIISILIEEEKKHLVKLVNLREELAAGPR